MAEPWLNDHAEVHVCECRATLDSLKGILDYTMNLHYYTHAASPHWTIILPFMLP